MADYDAIVVGCGHNGLVAAFYLAQAGMRVLALEGRETVGGACRTDELFPGYRFSTCAHSFVIFHPQILHDMRLYERGLHVYPRDPAMFQPLRSGQYLLFWQDLERTKASIAQFSRADAEAFPRWQAFWQQAARIVAPYLLTEPPTYAELLARTADTPDEALLHRLLFGTTRDLLEEYFESDVMRAALLRPFDSGSLDAPGALLYWAIHAAISHQLTPDAGHQQSRLMGAGYPRGGMGAVTQTMQRAVEDLGVAVRTHAPVAEILVRANGALGVRLQDGTEITGRTVLSNADPRRTFLRLVRPEALPAAFLTQVRRLHATAGYLKVHCALKGLPDWTCLPGAHLQPHHFGQTQICRSLEMVDQAWLAARTGRLPDEFALGIITPSVYDDSAAPPGHHTASIWAEYAPVHPPEGWDRLRAETALRIIGQVAQYAPNFPDIIQDTYVWSPWDIEQQLQITDGSMHHLDMTPDQMFARRPLPGWARYRTPVSGLYLCGSGCHPGGGVTGIPGHNAAQAV
ncbi:MAG: NAD(P)/FAD-dependent oxidoreductase, partial [Actinobacteria bacterium]|nr:NAD(P)/FAD-dependent oxidoreductase [Actinomycetota bacterium]